MKAILLHLALVMLLPSAFCQNSVTTKTSTPQPTEKDRWNLDKYVFSHINYKTGKNDKPVIDFEALDNWPGLGDNQNVAVSSDGKYFAYTVVAGRKKPDSLIVQSTLNSWQQSFLGAKPGFFSADSKQYIFKDKETLCFLRLGGSIEVIKGVGSFQLLSDQKNEWLAYQIKDGNAMLVLKELKTGKGKTFTGDFKYSFDKSASWLALQKQNTQGLELYNLKTGISLTFSSVATYEIDANGKSIVIKDHKDELLFTDLSPAVKPTVLWSPANPKQKIGPFKQDTRGSQVVFTMQDENKINSIWYYKPGMDKAVKKVSKEAIGADLLISEPISFTGNGRYIQFSVQPKPELHKPMVDAVNVDVWTYNDAIFNIEKPGQIKLFKGSVNNEPLSYSFLFNVENNQVVRLENEGENLYSLQGDYAIVKKKGNAVFGDRFWEKGYDKDSNWLVSLTDGKRTLLPTRAEKYNIWFTPGGNYIVSFDTENCHYFSYDLRTGKYSDISAGDDFCKKYPYVNVLPKQSNGPAAWIEGDRGLLVYDNYDIWQLDLSGMKPAINLTNGYGSSHSIQFSLSGGDRHWGETSLIVAEKESLLLKAFNCKNKYDGFYRMRLGQTANPEMLYMGPYFFEDQRGAYGTVPTGVGMEPIKAANNNVWIVKRQSTAESPNYFATKDFKNYRQLTYQEPQKKYNWYSAQLISFPQLDGTLSQGVLYKPDNFDASRKYPVIINFYGALSDRLYQYLEPAYINRPNIFDSPAWLVSHGYLVFLPDIYKTAGEWGRSTVNTIDGAAKYLSGLPYVDSLHLGAVGHSNSGILGYYLLTHSTSFAAMSVGAGTTDMISRSLSSLNSLKFFEIGHEFVPGYGTDLWEHKAEWIDQTAVLSADKVTSPLLIFQNKDDGAFQSATEMFIALRRLKKPVWWLQYDDGDHVLNKLRDKKDFTIRYTQFFDRYLKGAPAPAWMEKGIPNELKGVESRYELESK